MKVDVVLAGSGWYYSDPNTLAEIYGNTVEHWQQVGMSHHREVVDAPVRLAKMVGAPVAHANLVGEIASYRFPTGSGTISRYFRGESQIVSSDGQVIDKRPTDKGEGIVIGEVVVGHRDPLLEIGTGFWHYREDNVDSIAWWYDGYGRDYYLTVTQPQRELYARSRRPPED